MSFRVTSIDVVDVTLPYAEQGERLGPTLLLLHGIGDSYRAFERILPHLPGDLHVVAPTLRGHGDASRPESGYTPADVAGDLVGLVDALGLDRVVVVGASSGGVVARRFVLDAPERARGLVLAGSPRTLADKPAVRQMWNTRFSTLSDPIDPAFVRDFVAGTSSGSVPAEFLDMMIAESSALPARVWRDTLAGLMLDDSFERLPEISVPTIVMWGDGDEIIPREDQMRLASEIPRARLVVYEGAGHTFYWEQPERFATDLAQFAR